MDEKLKAGDAVLVPDEYSPDVDGQHESEHQTVPVAALKPGDKVLVEARLVEWPEDEFRKVTAAENSHDFGRSFHPRTEHVYPHPGIDPALLPDLVVAVRRLHRARTAFVAYMAERAEAARRLWDEGNGDIEDRMEPEDTSYRNKVRVARRAVCDLAARMEADEKTKLAADIGAACCGGFREDDDDDDAK